MLKNYYDLFKIPRSATKEEIAEAYDALIERYGQKFKGEAFNKNAAILDKAYKVLANERTRLKYDEMLREMEAEDEEEETEAFEEAPAAPSAPVKREPAIAAEKKAAPVKKAEEVDPAAERRELIMATVKKPEPAKKADKNEANAEARNPFMASAKHAAEEDEEDEPRQKRRLTGLIIAIVVAFLLLAGGGFYFYNYIYLPESHYKDALALVKAEKYNDAISAFTKLKDYKDSPAKIIEIKRAIGNQYIQEKNYDKALEVFNSLGSQEDVNTAKKAMAADMLAAKEYDKAIAVYQEIGDTDGVNNCKYTRASDLLQDGKQLDAYTIFKELGEYKESASKLDEIKTNAQTEITTELGNITQTQLTLMSFDNAKQSVVKLNELETMAKTYMLDSLYSEIQSKWAMVDTLYYGTYAKNLGDTQNKKNEEYFEVAATVDTDSVSKASSHITAQFAEKPEYVSLYLKCLAGVSEKELRASWYKYSLDHATGDFKERAEIAKSEAQTLPEIKKNYSTLFEFEKNAFAFGAGLYSVEVTATGDSDPCAIVYFYLQG